MSDFKINKPRREWLDALAATGETTFTTQTAQAVAEANGWNGIPLWFRSPDSPFKIGRGVFSIAMYTNGSEPTPAPLPAPPSTIGLKGGMNYRTCSRSRWRCSFLTGSCHVDGGC